MIKHKHDGKIAFYFKAWAEFACDADLSAPFAVKIGRKRAAVGGTRLAWDP